MNLAQRIAILVQLGERIHSQLNSGDSEFYAHAKSQNAWFTQDNVELSLRAIQSNFLQSAQLEEFVKPYVAQFEVNAAVPKTIGVVASGNIPAVVFHDILCVFLSGHKLALKISSTDPYLVRWLLNEMMTIEPAVGNYVQLVPTIAAADAYIATGSDNSSRYFDYYFGKKPHIIRRNRVSVAVLTGNESKIELADLGNDIFQYFGLGCRNVAKLFVPQGYNFTEFYESIEYWSTIQLHHKYNNNYDYNKSIYLINGVEHLDNGFLMLKPDEAWVSPLSVVFYEEYATQAELINRLEAGKEKIQAIVGHGYIPFGQAQKPQLTEFADNVNTLDFLAAL